MAIYIKNISKSYRDKKALQNCTLTLNTGIYALLGPNGAGKSTLMNILVGNLLPDSGEILYQDEQTPAQNILEMGKDYRTKLGFMPQYPGMYPNFTVEYFMRYMSYLKCADKENKTSRNPDENQTEITEILKAVESTHGARREMRRRWKLFLFCSRRVPSQNIKLFLIERNMIIIIFYFKNHDLIRLCLIGRSSTY